MHVPTHLPHESLVLHVDSTLHQFWGLRLSGTHSVSDRMDIILPPINFGSSGKIPKIKNTIFSFVVQVLRTDLPPAAAYFLLGNAQETSVPKAKFIFDSF